MAVLLTGRRQFPRLVGMRPADMVRVIVAAPEVLWIVVEDEQALAVMPARAEDVIIFLALRRALLLAQAEPFAVRVLFDAVGHLGRDQRAITGGLEKETEMHVGQAIEAEFLVDPADFGQQLAPEGHQIAFDSIDVGTLAGP